MKILLTGSNGMLGASLSCMLSRSKHTVCATGKGSCRLPEDLFHDRFNYHELDITNKEEVFALSEKFKPDAIIHSAAMTQVDDCERNKSICYSVNVEGTRNLIEAAEEHNSRFCYLSTDFVFDGTAGPYEEKDKTNPVNFYGETKELAEQFVMSSELNWSIVRTVLLFGKAEPSKRSNFIYWVKENLEAKKTIRVVNDQIRTPTFIHDLVNGIDLILTRGARGIYHLAGNDVLTPYKMAVAVANHLQLDATLIHPVDASSFTQIGKRPLITGFKIDKAINDLGYQPTSFEKALSFIF